MLIYAKLEYDVYGLYMEKVVGGVKFRARWKLPFYDVRIYHWGHVEQAVHTMTRRLVDEICSYMGEFEKKVNGEVTGIDEFLPLAMSEIVAVGRNWRKGDRSIHLYQFVEEELLEELLDEHPGTFGEVWSGLVNAVENAARGENFEDDICMLCRALNVSDFSVREDKNNEHEGPG